MIDPLRKFVNKELWNQGYVYGKSEQLFNIITIIKEMEIPITTKEEIIRILEEDFYE